MRIPCYDTPSAKVVFDRFLPDHEASGLGITASHHMCPDVHRDIHDKTNIVCFAVPSAWLGTCFAGRKNCSLSTNDGVFQTEPNTFF
ncbi:MAG: hypothetical protein ACYS8Z_17185 [Planctomycetota bacterium]